MGKYKTFGSRFDRVHRNDLNANFAAVEADINSQKSRVDDLIIGTPQPSEVVDSRGGFPVLGDRLEDLSTSLAQIVTVNVGSFPRLDGEVDDAPRIRRAIAALPLTNARLHFPTGEYLQGDGTNPSYPRSGGVPTGSAYIGVDNTFTFTGYENLIISGYGAIIRANTSNSPIANNGGFNFICCKNVLVEGLTYDGRLDVRTALGGDWSGYNEQSAFKVSAYDRIAGQDKECSNVTFENVTAINSMMDGFLVYGRQNTNTLPTNIKFKNCISKYNYRQGMSIVGTNGCIVEGGEYSFTGTIKGTSPTAGIDAEANNGQVNKGVSIKDVRFEGNIGSGLALHWGTYGAVVDRCKFIDNELFCPNDVTYTQTVNNTVQNCEFFNATLNMLGGGALILNNKFYLNKDKVVAAAMTIDDVSNAYANGKSRRNRVENNIIITDLTGVTATTIGRVVIGNGGTIFNKNTIINSIAANYIVYCTGQVEEFIGNDFIFNFDSRSSAGVFLGTPRKYKNNSGSSQYGTTIFNTLSDSQAITTERFVIKNFFVDYTKMSANKCVDLTLDKVGSELYGFIKIKLNGETQGAEAQGYSEEVFILGSPTSTYQKQRTKTVVLRSIDSGILVSDLYQKNGYWTITLKAPSTSSMGVHLVVERFAQTPINADAITISSAYTYDSAANLNFPIYYNGGKTGSTANRPSSPTYIVGVGAQYYDTTLNKPIWCKSTGVKEVDTLTVSAGAIASGNITITLNGVATNVAVAAGDSAGNVGDKIRASVFSGWTVSGTTGSATVTFTKISYGTNSAPTFADSGTTGTTASFAVTTVGANTIWIDSTGTAV
jgi:hypothetical protein